MQSPEGSEAQEKTEGQFQLHDMMAVRKIAKNVLGFCFNLATRAGYFSWNFIILMQKTILSPGIIKR